MVEFKDPAFRVQPPLIYYSFSNDPLDSRLAALHEAISAGEDPNELGGMKNPGIARPLHYAICDSAGHDYAQLKQNLPVVELLLEAGADPRLPDLMGRSPIVELEAWFDAYDKGHEHWAPEDLDLYPFNKAALEAMKKAVAKLDSKIT